MTVIDKILNEWSFRCHDGIVDMNNPTKVSILNEILKEYNLDEQDEENIDDKFLDFLGSIQDNKVKEKLYNIVLKAKSRIDANAEDKEEKIKQFLIQDKNIPEDISEYIVLRCEKREEIDDLNQLLKNPKTLEELGEEGKLDVRKLTWINNLTATQSSLSLGKGEILLAIMLKDAKLARSTKYDIDYPKGVQVEVKQSSINEKGIKSGGIISSLGRSSNYKNIWDKELSGGKSFKEKYFEKKERKSKGEIVVKYPELSTWTPIINRYFEIPNKSEFINDLNQALSAGKFKGEIKDEDFDKNDFEKFTKKIAFLAVGDYLKNKVLILLSSQLEYLILDEDEYKNAILNNTDIHANNAFLPRISYKEIPTNLEDEEIEETEPSDEEINISKEIQSLINKLGKNNFELTKYGLGVKSTIDNTIKNKLIDKGFIQKADIVLPDGKKYHLLADKKIKIDDLF